MPGALTSTRFISAPSASGPFAVDRIAEGVDNAAQELLADRDLDDGAGPLDQIAFLDVPVIAEDNDADIVGFEIERHALGAIGELDHLAGADLVEAVNAGDTVTDRQHLADLGDVRFLVEAGNLFLQNGGDFSGADFHQLTPFIASWRRCNLVLRELSIMRDPTLTIRPPMMSGSTWAVDRDFAADGPSTKRIVDGGHLRVS